MTSGWRVPLFQRGDFTLHGGAKSTYKIDCDAFSESDWSSIASMIVNRIGPFSVVVGVPRGGLKLEQMLWRTPEPAKSS